MGNRRLVYVDLVWKAEGKRPFGKTGSRWEGDTY
jgi:hypothetical protein